MPIPRSNSLLPLSGNTPQIFGSIRDAKQQGAQIKATEARTSFIESQQQAVEDQRAAIENQAREQAARNAEFESIFRGVKELEPLLDDMPAFIEAAERRRANIRTTNPNTDDTDHIIQLARANDRDAIERQFAQVNEIARQRQFQRFDTEAPGPDNVPSQIQSRDDLIGGFSPEDQVTARRIEAGLEPRAATSAAERIAGDQNVTDSVANSQSQIAGATETAKTQAQIDVDLANAEQVGAANARQAALQEAAVQGERIKADHVRTTEEAAILLPEAQAGNQKMKTQLSAIRNHPELKNVLGFIEGGVDARLDPAESELIGMIDQVVGDTFLEAYQSLKGGGPITDIEGQAATDAQSRLKNRNVEVSAYQAAIDELIGLSDARLARLTTKAGGSQTAEQSTEFTEGQTATGPNGEKAVFTNGQWVTQ